MEINNNSRTISEKSKKSDLNDQPVALRTRRLSGTLEAVKTLSKTSLSSEKVDIPAKGLDPGTVQRESRGKHSRSHHRHDYNELANGRSRNQNNILRKVARAQEKNESDRNEKDIQLLNDQANLIPEALIFLKRRRENQVLKQRLVETEESSEMIEKKSQELAKLISDSKHVVIYTGAGISTSASIPDYRGPNGLWTQIKRTGNFSMTRVFKDLCKAEPTFTHMSIKELCRRQMVKHVVSQNFDGLHIRSGVPQEQLSEIHGNMFIEICPKCERQYFRPADVTQKTSRFRHKTGRQCHKCRGPSNNLMDTIVLYGERSRSKWPMNWERASKSAKNADLIICIGSSLKTLRRYSCLWPKSITTSSTRKVNQSIEGMDRRDETKLVIVNLQHTSKDKNAVLKINAKCDLVMEHVMRHLNISVPKYELADDQLQRLATPFNVEELAKLERDLVFEEAASQNFRNGPNTTDCNYLQEPKVKREPLEKDEQKEALELNCEVSPEVACNESVAPNQDEHMAKRPRIEATEFKLDCSTDDRCSPSLFVSELTDDPDRRSLRMRIRALTPTEV